MKNSNRRHKINFYAFLLGLAIIFGTFNVAEATTNDSIEIDKITLDTNGLGIVLNNDMVNFSTNGSNVYILIGLSQGTVLNGIYLAGFGPNGTSMLSYKLGNPTKSNNIWFSKGTEYLTNYGSIIYFDILDYTIAFGVPDDVKGVILQLPDSFDTITSGIYYQQLLNYLNTPLTTTSTNSSSISTNSEVHSSTNSVSTSISGFELFLTVPILMFAVLLNKFRKKSN